VVVQFISLTLIFQLLL